MDMLWQHLNQSFGVLLSQLLTIERWPFYSAMTVFALIGQWTSTRLFTREYAYHAKPKWFWYWARETLPVHPIAAGAVTAALWPDPEAAGWKYPATAMYFMTAGVFSLFLWIILKAILKQRGIRLQLPGDSDRPSATSLLPPRPPPLPPSADS